MKTITVTMVWVVAFLMVACSSSDESSGPSGIPPGTADLLKFVAFSGDVLRLERRLVSYSIKTQHVSIIDPIRAQEEWGTDTGVYRFAVALPGFQGASLFNDQQVTVISKTSQRHFILSSSHNNVSVAKDAAAYSLSSNDGFSVEVIRTLGNGQWQHDTFDVPWQAGGDQVVTNPVGQLPLLVSRFSDKGDRLYVLNPVDGRYAELQAAAPDLPIETTDIWCDVVTDADQTFQSIAWDEALQFFYVGDNNGQVYALDMNGGCKLIAEIPTYSTGKGPIVGINILSSNNLGIVQKNVDQPSTFFSLSFSNNTFFINDTFDLTDCENPLSSLALGDLYIVIMCDEPAVENRTPENAGNGITDPKTYIILDKSTGLEVNRLQIRGDLSAGIAIDSESLILYRMTESAFGTLEKTHLVSGETQRIVGLYLEGILN